MPAVSIEVRQQYSQQQEIQIMNAVHAAIVTAFKIPEHDRDIRFIVHEAHRFQCPPDKLQAECFTLISIDCFTGRSVDTKRHLYQGIVKNLLECGIPEDHVKIILREHPAENWGIRGGQAACDVDLGFDVKV